MLSGEIFNKATLNCFVSQATQVLHGEGNLAFRKLTWAESGIKIHWVGSVRIGVVWSELQFSARGCLAIVESMGEKRSPNRTARMRSLIWGFAFRLTTKCLFMGPSLHKIGFTCHCYFGKEPACTLLRCVAEKRTFCSLGIWILDPCCASRPNLFQNTIQSSRLQTLPTWGCASYCLSACTRIDSPHVYEKNKKKKKKKKTEKKNNNFVSW